MSSDIHSLDSFNQASESELLAQLEDIFGSRALALKVANDRPYDSVSSLLSSADDHLSRQLSEEIIEAVRAHPRIGAAAKAGSNSEREQAASRNVDEETAARLGQLNDEYEAKFGQTFLIFANGRGASEIVSELERRLGESPEAEAETTREQLRLINRLRLERMLS